MILIERRRRFVLKRSAVFGALLLLMYAMGTAEPATQSQKEKNGSQSDAKKQETETTKEEWEKMVVEIEEMAEEEIERTAQEAVKAALVEAGAELAAEQGKAELYRQKAFELEEINTQLGVENGRLQKEVRIWKAAGYVSIGVMIASLALSFFN